MSGVHVGDVAPDFIATDQNGRGFRLADYRGRIVVLFFYPRDGTPVCTAQACSLRDAHAELTRLNSVVVGISPDTTESHRATAAAHHLPFPLISDASGDLRRLYAVSRWLGLIPGRATIVIDGSGVIRDINRNPWRGAGHGARALACVRSLHAAAP